MKAHPFLKWVGGKRGLLEQLRPMLPTTFNRYHEPFVGGGAMFFDIAPQHAFLSDANEELVNCYESIRGAPLLVVSEIEALSIDEDTFYRVRAMNPNAMGPAARAARMIYLNKTCFNGLYRVNKSGGFNSPWGRWPPDKLPTACDEKNIRACSEALRFACISRGDFADVLERACAGDFVYFDPPYVPVSKTANFTSYTAGGFNLNDLERLAGVCRALSFKGAQFMLSNADTPEVREAFAGFRIDVVMARRAVNCDASKRGKVGEVVVRNYDLAM